MTALLEHAFSEAKKLAPENQDALAALIMEEMLAEKKWEALFARSQNKLELLADEDRTASIGGAGGRES